MKPRTKISYEGNSRKDAIKAYYANNKSLKEEIIATRGRLINEAGTYIKAIQVHNSTHDYGVGFFGSVRLLVPVIEHLTFILYGNKKADSRNKVLKDLGVAYPSIVWHIFRHPLMHGDEPCQITIGNQIVTWYIQLYNQSHRYEVMDSHHRQTDGKSLPGPIVIHLDIIKLYNDMLSYMQELAYNLNEKKQTFTIRETVLMKTKTKKIRSGKGYKLTKKTVNEDVQKELKNLRELYNITCIVFNTT